MKELPKVFEGKVKDNLQNTQEMFYGSSRNERSSEQNFPDSLTVIRKINSIFASSSHVYKSKVLITLKDGEVEKVIVGKTSVSLLTIKGEHIPIKDILDIQKI